MAEEVVRQRVDKFHAHLDVCTQCRNNPFGLCAVGAALLFGLASHLKEAVKTPHGKAILRR